MFRKKYSEIIDQPKLIGRKSFLLRKFNQKLKLLYTRFVEDDKQMKIFRNILRKIVFIVCSYGRYFLKRNKFLK